jgi:hypothetical protein
MMKPAFLALLAAATVTCSGCTQAAPAGPYKPVATVIDLMKSTVDPAAKVYWGSVSTTISAAGVDEKYPRSNEEWDAVWGGAMTVAESGNLLMMPSRARDEEWMRLSAALVDVGVEAAKAAKSRNPEAVLEMGEKMYNVCTECHMKYLPAEE